MPYDGTVLSHSIDQSSHLNFLVPVAPILFFFSFVHTDFDESKLEVLAQEHGSKDYVVFYCMYGQLRSPAAALSFLKALGKDSTSENNVYAFYFVLYSPYKGSLVLLIRQKIIIDGIM